MQEEDVFSCRDCITVNGGDDGVLRRVYWRYIGGCGLEEECSSGGDGWAGQHAVFCCFLSSSCEGHGCHSTIRGSGSPPAEHSIVSCPLNRQRGEREVQPLLWHRCKTAEERKKTSDDCIITQWMQSLPHQHFSFFSIHSFSSPLSLSFFSGRVSAN